MPESFISKLFPKDTPIELLIEHAEILHEVTEKLEVVVEKYLKNEDIDDLVKEISDKESRADKIKFKLRALFSKKIKTPYAATDVLEYLHKQDFLIDSMEDISKKLSLNKIEGLDDSIKETFLKLVKEVSKSMQYLQKMINNAKKVLESSFAKKLIKEKEIETGKLEDLEGRVDKISIELGKWIYSKKKELNPIDLIFFREVILLFVRIADEA